MLFQSKTRTKRSENAKKKNSGNQNLVKTKNQDIYFLT